MVSPQFIHSPGNKQMSWLSQPLYICNNTVVAMETRSRPCKGDPILGPEDHLWAQAMLAHRSSALLLRVRRQATVADIRNELLECSVMVLLLIGYRWRWWVSCGQQPGPLLNTSSVSWICGSAYVFDCTRAFLCPLALPTAKLDGCHWELNPSVR